MSSRQFRLKEIYETRNYLLDEINHNDLVSVSISGFASLVFFRVGITNSAVGTKFVQPLQKLKSIG